MTRYTRIFRLSLCLPLTLGVSTSPVCKWKFKAAEADPTQCRLIPTTAWPHRRVLHLASDRREVGRCSSSGAPRHSTNKPSTLEWTAWWRLTMYYCYANGETAGLLSARCLHGRSCGKNHITSNIGGVLFTTKFLFLFAKYGVP